MLRQITIYWKVSFTVIIAISLVLLADSSLKRIDYLLYNNNLRIFFTFLAAIILGCGTAWVIAKYYIKNFTDKIAYGMDELAEKKFDYRLDEEEQDEFSEITSSFNNMAILFSSYQMELKRARDFLENILEGTADLIISVSANGKILTFNAGAERVLGYQRFDVIGKPIETIFANPSDREAALERLKYGDNVVNIETQFLTKSGDTKTVLLTLSLMRHPKGAFIGTFGISKDITDEKRLQDQLIQSQRLAAIGEVFIGIQHSMKNMLNTCKGGGYMVRTGLAKDNKKMLEEGWVIVQEGIDRMAVMAKDMLNYVKEWKPKFVEVDLTQLLSDIDKVVKQNAKDKGIDFEVDISRKLPPVECDTRMIHSIVMDIVSNALDACTWKEYIEGEIPKIALSAYINNGDGNAIIEVKDNGCGMTEELKTNIFTPFFSTKSKAGTGLGLSITSRMIDVHNGKINVDSEPEKGSTFRIVLPINANNKRKEKDDG